MADNPNDDPYDTCTKLANLTLERLHDCKNFKELDHALMDLLILRNDAIVQEDGLLAIVYSHFLDGALFGLLELRPPVRQLKPVLAELTRFVSDSLSTWCIDVKVPRKNRGRVHR